MNRSPNLAYQRIVMYVELILYIHIIQILCSPSPVTHDSSSIPSQRCHLHPLTVSTTAKSKIFEMVKIIKTNAKNKTSKYVAIMYCVNVSIDREMQKWRKPGPDGI